MSHNLLLTINTFVFLLLGKQKQILFILISEHPSSVFLDTVPEVAQPVLALKNKNQ